MNFQAQRGIDGINMAIVGETSIYLRSILSNVWRRHSPNFVCCSVRARNHHSQPDVDGSTHDVTIVGGGMVGTAMAVALAKNRAFEEKKIILLESNEQCKYEKKENYSNRVVALNKQTRTLLSSIGAWKYIENERFAPVRKMQVWDASSDAMITFNEDYLSDEIAYIVESDLVQHALDSETRDQSNLNIMYNAKVEDISPSNNRGENSLIKLKDGQQFSTRLLIGADGANSRVRQAMGTQYIKWDYEQMGIVATIKLSEPTENVVAWQRFLPTGPVALLPLTDDQSSLVWSLPTDEAKRLLKIPDDEFVDALNDALWKVYPKDTVVEGGMNALQQLLSGLSLQTGISRQLQPSIAGIAEQSRAAFPLGFGHAVTYAANGIVLIGDAAHRVHPLAGQGVNLGFGDVTTLVKILDEAVRNGSILGDILYLSRYETLRQRHNVPTMLVIDALHRLYKGTAAPVVLARSLGLQLLNALGPLKRMMMDHASDEVPVAR